MANSKHTYFAELDPDGMVIRVVVASPVWIAKQPGTWVQTWMADGQARGRKNYAGPGCKWDTARNAFIAPKPTASATLDEATATWVIPDKPGGGKK